MFRVLWFMPILGWGCAHGDSQADRQSGAILKGSLRLQKDEQPRLGKPVVLDFGLINAGTIPLGIAYSHALANDTLIVTGPDGERVRYIAGKGGGTGDLELAPGESATIDPEYDLSAMYLIDRPGRYRVEYHGEDLEFSRPAVRVLPTAFEFEVAPGKLRRWEEVGSRLARLMPRHLALAVVPEEDDPGKARPAKVVAGIMSAKEFMMEEGSEHLGLCFSAAPTDGDSRCLGTSAWGHVFVDPGNQIHRIWPSWEKDLMIGLGITPR